MNQFLAHGGEGGGNAELTIFFGGLVFLGIVMGSAKSVKAPVAVGIVVAGLAGVIGSIVFAPGAPTSDLAISITSLRDGDSVEAGEPFQVAVSVHDGKIATSASDTENPHLHIFVDGELDSMPYTTSPEIELDPGDHEITVELVDANHAPYDPPVRDSVEVTAD